MRPEGPQDPRRIPRHLKEPRGPQEAQEDQKTSGYAGDMRGPRESQGTTGPQGAQGARKYPGDLGESRASGIPKGGDSRGPGGPQRPQGAHVVDTQETPEKPTHRGSQGTSGGLGGPRVYQKKKRNRQRTKTVQKRVPEQLRNNSGKTEEKLCFPCVPEQLRNKWAFPALRNTSGTAPKQLGFLGFPCASPGASRLPRMP